METEFRHLPSVDKVLAEKRLKELARDYPHDLLVSIIRQCLESERLSIAAGNPSASMDEIVASVYARNTFKLSSRKVTPVLSAIALEIWPSRLLFPVVYRILLD